MDLASALVRSVVRAFYETRQILVVDALFTHSVLHAEDLAHLLGMQQKDLRKLCARLREDRLIAVHTRSEIREGSTRPVNRDYYYIPLHPVIDAIKYRVLRLTSSIKAQYTPSEDRKEYICLRCGAEWTELDVLSLYSDEGFECQSCGAILERTEDVKGTEGLDRTGHEKNSKLMAQLEAFTSLLKQIDATEIPVNDFETAWDHKVEVIRNQQTHPSKPAIAAAAKQPAAVRGNQRVDAAAIEVSLQSSAEKTAAEQAADAARKAAFEKQNALPVWHTHSTVSTTAGNINKIKAETDAEIRAEIKDEAGAADETKPSTDALDDIAAYYAEIAKAKAEEATSPDEDDSDDDEDEDEFEDISVVGTPATTTVASGGGGGPTSAPVPGRSSAGIKRELESESGGSSAPQTATGTPGTPADDGPVSKKVKTEEDVIKKEEESDEDEEEFEDVS
ncbi:transcription factor TFIIE complex alpha subunit, putative [Talaromyces stipitatus ATCC 10500]|uniref:Transcription factor TFIIE complex alpha subunit, putative n=1 Tax=Talaromyces stipitatus (strain ATCC 10500 / CBS 375.48 / QM 6759 / NRRL 1006) TaxID=441959 RepID=B8M1I0_TALSN|nr:transcription factor TFIIE complex alpha subunit, putative [Talaromyces stipitatus ATCC 10500]EED21876.1 transcription factor TFIIE complex alpha subunit, putative [Talaromyces stipitatus ATCC 10500]